MLYRCILAKWKQEEDPKARRSYEGEFSEEEIKRLNAQNYHIYFFPNAPTEYQPGKTTTGADIDAFRFVFCDYDAKTKAYESKESFVKAVSEIPPSFIVDSGNGVHVYWEVSDLDAKSYLRLQRRLARKFNTDLAVSQVCQLMRVPGTVNPKHKDAFKQCDYIDSSDAVYTCEELDKLLPPLIRQDEEHCEQHYNKTYNLDPADSVIDDKIPLKFAQLLKSNPEVKDIWTGNVEDRSAGDYRLGHIMFASDFTKAEATSVLVNTSKAISRAPVHRLSYAQNIVDKIWTFEEAPKDASLDLSSTVKEILARPEDGPKGARLPCHAWIDGTDRGYRLGDVVGLVAGSGVGKTAVALNMLLGFLASNPDLDHFFVSLEQPANEIAERWKLLCQGNTRLYDKMHVISNYADDGTFRNLSLAEIKDYILRFQKATGRKVGAVVVDHVGALKKKSAQGENQALMDIFHEMKAVAVETNSLWLMQSQASREKAGDGDLEIGKDAAYGSVFFESYVDFLLCIWQPLKKCHNEKACPTVTAFKFSKIRHKTADKDRIFEDVRYRVRFDPVTGILREMTQEEDTSFDFFNKKCVNKRKQDRKTDLVEYTTLKWKN